MSDIHNLDKLKVLNDRLTSLLSDEQTGVFSWHDALSEVLTEIAEYAPKKKPIDYSTWDCYYESAWVECTPSRESDCSYKGKCKKCPSNRISASVNDIDLYERYIDSDYNEKGELL